MNQKQCFNSSCKEYCRARKEVDNQRCHQIEWRVQSLIPENKPGILTTSPLLNFCASHHALITMPSNGPKWLPGILFLHDTPTHLLLGPSKLLALVSFFTLGALAKYWHGQVISIVPQPYLDEVFHVPQALAYCEGRYGVWDPKLTTPPGL